MPRMDHLTLFTEEFIFHYQVLATSWTFDLDHPFHLAANWILERYRNKTIKDACDPTTANSLYLEMRTIYELYFKEKTNMSIGNVMLNWTQRVRDAKECEYVGTFRHLVEHSLLSDAYYPQIGKRLNVRSYDKEVDPQDLDKVKMSDIEKLANHILGFVGFVDEEGEWGPDL